MKNAYLIIILGIGLVTGYFVRGFADAPNPDSTTVAINYSNARMPEARVKELRQNYAKKLDSLGKDSSMSFHVTFNKSMFIQMGKDLEKDNQTDKLKGVRVYFIRYDERYKSAQNGQTSYGEYEIPGKRFIRQNSLVFVPVDKKGKPVWDAWKAQPSELLDGLNHGEICPDSCSTDY